MPRWAAVPLAIALAGGVSACGDAQPDSNNPLAQLTAAAEQMQKTAKGFTTNRKPVPPVAFRELMDFLPEKMPGMKADEPYVPFTMVLSVNMARESTEGYEKSVKIEGYPAFEKWNRNGKSEIVVLVGDRFIVKSDTRGLGEGSARKVVEDLDLKGLAAKGK